MSGKYQAYPEYKDSAVAGISTLPAHWAEVPLKHVATCNDEVLPENIDPDFEFHYIDISSVSKTEGVTRTEKLKFSAAPSRARRVVKSGDVIVSTVRTYLEAIAPISHQHEGMVASTGFAVIRPTRLESTFAQYALRAQHFIDEVVARSTGVSYPAINASDLVCISTPVPPIQEQRTIAAFLDHETARIDRLIEKQQRLIELLREKRQAVISHAVTKGLDPDVPMKDSGVEWLGQVPEHWEVTRLKFVAKIVDCKNRTPEYVDAGAYLVVRTTNVKNQRLVLDGAMYTDEENFNIWTQRGVPPAGSILFTREAPAGEVCLVPEGIPLCMGQRMMNFIPYDAASTKFLFDYLTSDCLNRYIESEASGSTVTHLRVEQVYNIPVVVPPQKEQAAIDTIVSAMKKRFECLVMNVEGAIQLLQERRTALISAAVTGKIDVRNWQPNTSTQSDEPDLPMAAEQAGRYHV